MLFLTKQRIFIIDSTCSFAENYLNHDKVKVLPIVTILDEKAYREFIDLSHIDFYTKLPTLKIPPTTSQPPLNEVVELFEKLSEDNVEAIAITLASKLSGTYQTLTMAKEMTGANVTVIDSESSAYISYTMLQEGLKLDEQGATTEEITKHLEKIKYNGEFYIFPKDMGQLARSGRVTGLQNFIGSLLKITPVLSVHHGMVENVDKVRSLKSAKSWLVDKYNTRITTNKITKLCILHANDLEAANEWKQLIEETVSSDIEIVMDSFAIAIGVHTGQGSIGVIWVYE
ncbi:MAG: hypothetical protein K0S51_780 [Bacillales bacterium]|nr:hypothetical protein [Bacillales bacterium]